MSHIGGPRYPDWQRAIRDAQAPQLPSRPPGLPVEERFNQTHGFHGEFASSGNSKPAASNAGGSGTAPGGFKGMTANAAVEGGKQQPTEQQEAAQRAALIAQAKALETKAANSTQMANAIQQQLDAVKAQLAQLTGTASLTAPVPGGAQLGSSSGTPSTSAAASGTATLASAGTAPAAGTGGTQSFTSGTATYADQIATLQGQSSAYQTQISALRDQAADYTQQASTLRAQAAAIK